MTHEMRRLFKIYSIFIISMLGIFIPLGIFFLGIANTIFFFIGLILSSFNILTLGVLIEAIVKEEIFKIIYSIAIKIITIAILLILAYRYKIYLTSIISGVILSLILTIVSLALMQRKDV